MPRFSLIIPTLERTAELAELLASIVNQERTDIEIILVDQNQDDRIAPLVEALPGDLAVLHLRLRSRMSLQHATRAWMPLRATLSLFRMTIVATRLIC